MLIHMKKCLIISGGDFCSLPPETKYDYIIACDKGLQYSADLGLCPNLAIGDFDSYEYNIDDFNACEVQKYPSRKDDSDTMLAIKYALAHGYSHIIISCALGGRLDHTMANIQAMSYVASHKGICEIISSSEHLISTAGPMLTLPKQKDYSLSLFSMSDSCIVSISGAGYDVENITLSNTFPIGLSNYWVQDYVNIKISDGILLVVMSRH